MEERDKQRPATRAAQRAQVGSRGGPSLRALGTTLFAVAAIILLPAASLARGTAPELSAHGHRLTWTAVQGQSTYRLLSRSGEANRVQTLSGRSATPPAQPGLTVTYRVRATGAGTWSNAVSIAYPEVERSEPPPPAEMIVGLNAGGWGPSAWPDVSGAVKDVRLESRFANDTEVGAAAAAGVRVDTWLFGTSGTIGKINPAT